MLALLPGVPEQVAEKGSFMFRKEEHANLIRTRLAESSSTILRFDDAAANPFPGQSTAHERFQPHQLLIGIKDPQMWLGSLMVGVAGTGIGAFSVFVPTFITEFGFGAYSRKRNLE